VGTIGWTEILLVLLVLIIVFGSTRIPVIAESLGKGIKIFKKSVKESPEDKKDKDEKSSEKS